MTALCRRPSIQTNPPRDVMSWIKYRRKTLFLTMMRLWIPMRNSGCVSTNLNRYCSVFFFLIQKQNKIPSHKELHQTQSRRQAKKKEREERQQKKTDGDTLGELPVKQIKLESRGRAAKSGVESESFAGTEIIPHSSVVLTNPGSACAPLAPRDSTSPPKTETGSDSKRRGPDSMDRNQCQDDL